MNGRVLIEQAKGILAERRRIAIDEAFSIFRDYARGHSPKISAKPAKSPRTKQEANDVRVYNAGKHALPRT
ncbi:ANTAR domain-containing protein [Streptomyces sp. NPDC059944]|uniref:ANTAR domain-containing protein n=1 Tax=unclassified Streptomyces TaxID=2593676 RepID=UPI0036695A13